MRAPDRTDRPRRSRWWAVLTAALLVAVAVGVAGALRGGGAAAVAALTRPGALPLLAGALAAQVAGLALAMLSWRRLLLDLAGPVARADSARIYFVGLLGKFVPGPIWGLLAHLRIGRALGLPPRGVATAFFVGLGVTLLTGATVGLLAAPGVLGGSALWLAAPALVVLGCLLRPGLVGRAAAVGLRVLRRPAPEAASPSAVRGSITAGLASWLVSGVHLWLVAVALGAPACPAAAVCVGAYGLSAVAGGFAVILPDGWGVREVVMVLALGTVLPVPAATVAALTSRVLVMASELGCAAIAVAVHRLARADSPSPGAKGA